VNVEALVPDDWAAVAEIYEQGLDTGTFEEFVPPWPEWDASHLVWPRLVARENGVVLGWAALAPISQRECYRGVAELSIYVANDARGKGVGRALLEELCRAADAARVWTLQASVLEGNDASVALHQACGFRIVGIREKLARKRGVWRDVTLMERRSAVVA
jgi:phosphinothricin acetyltransferase